MCAAETLQVVRRPGVTVQSLSFSGARVQTLVHMPGS